MPAQFTAGQYEVLEPGIYPAVLVGIEEATTNEGDKFLKWNFRVRLQDGGESNFTAASSTATGSKSKAYKWATILLGRVPQVGQTENLEGKVCQLHIIRNEEGYNRVESLLPFLAAAPVAPPILASPATGNGAAAPAAASVAAPNGDLPF